MRTEDEMGLLRRRNAGVRHCHVPVKRNVRLGVRVLPALILHRKGNNARWRYACRASQSWPVARRALQFLSSSPSSLQCLRLFLWRE
ncbi:hypothetical protein KCP78_02045 [Salmonella enterica subsp. enterica]|nr:hypothetical protein KCP78_02045 [Salmonella enterica subsp. enterica]